MSKSAALFRAANLIIMDYPFDAALESALNICDEAVIVVGQSVDDTFEYVQSFIPFYRNRLIIFKTIFNYDLMWQEKWWNLASELTDAEWLMYHDADEIIDESDAPFLREVMHDPNIHLISLPFVHFYMTPSYTRNFAPRATRIGRRSAGYRMRNWRSEQMPHAPACQMVWGENERDAHGYRGKHMHVSDAMIYHYSWCRNAKALAISQAKHVDWYKNGEYFGLTDGRIPAVKPHDFAGEITGLIAQGRVKPHKNSYHPQSMRFWLAGHEAEWRELEAQCIQLA